MNVYAGNSWAVSQTVVLPKPLSLITNHLLCLKEPCYPYSRPRSSLAGGAAGKVIWDRFIRRPWRCWKTRLKRLWSVEWVMLSPASAPAQCAFMIAWESPCAGVGWTRARLHTIVESAITTDSHRHWGLMNPLSHWTAGKELSMFKDNTMAMIWF